MYLDELYKKVSDKLYNIFFVDHKKYGRQNEDGSYKLVKETLTQVTIDDMLQNQKSLLTYQELHVVNTARIKWICIDLDISKKEIDDNKVNIENLRLVKAAADEVTNFLDSISVPYLLEFSGRRGFHVWVLFDKFVTKDIGYRLINVIIKNVQSKFDNVIIADKFPKTPYVSKKSKGIGFGVKLPLSQNQVSGKLSFLLNKSNPFDFDKDKWKSRADIEFLTGQLSILESAEYLKSEKIQEVLDQFEEKSLNTLYNKSKKVNTYLKNDINLNRILESLSGCQHISKILDNYEMGLGRRERAILVGLLIQLKTKDDENFGYNLLLELFSNIEGFNEEITKRNLSNLKYYQPVTCKSFDNCNKCNECSLYSPVELIEGVELAQQPTYTIRQIDKKFFDQITSSLHHYSFQNDEVPFYNFLKKLENLDFKHTVDSVQKIFTDSQMPIIESYKLERNEVDKVRDLYILDPLNNTISTFFTFTLHTLYFSEISNNSYGYQFSPSFYKHNIFNNWFANWAIYTRKIETILFNEEYADYYVIKFDIKSFYNSIDLKRLKIKIFEEAPRRIIDKLSELSEDDLRKHKSIVDYLIWLTVQITGNEDRGLPQGPAYARYLAELYLNSLDRLIESFILENDGRGFYNRFVDDVFIFVETEERAKNLFKKIKDWIAINGLELNQNKTKLSNVKVYAESGEYQKFKNNSKYDINKASKKKNILTEQEIQEALAKLSDLTNDLKFGLKDNLRFFYYQIKDDKRLDFIRRRLSKRLPFSKDGRGTLYWLFYGDLIQNHPDVFWELTSRSSEISGLSLTHFLNTILLSKDLEEHDIEDIVKNLHVRKDLSDADKVLIASLNFKKGTSINLKYDEKIMNAALETPNIRYELVHWKTVEQRLEQKDDKLLFLQEINRIIRDNTYDIHFLQSLANYCFYRFTEWYNDKTSTDFINSEDTLLLFYHVLCFVTLFEFSRDYTGVQYAWELLLNKSEEFGDLTNKNYEFTWINRLEEFSFDDFSNGSYSLILNDKKGNTLSTSKCRNEFRQQYRSVLLMLLFAKDKASDFRDFRESINQYIESDSLFYAWVNDKNVSLYPQDDEICLKNIALNGLIVLKKTDKLFVKSINKKLKLDTYEYLNIDQTVNIDQEAEYDYSDEILENRLNGGNIYLTLKNINDVISNHQKFIEQYNSNFLCFYKPAFTKDLKPMIPYYSDKSFENIITTGGTIEKNSISNYWNNIMSLISQSGDINLVPDDITNPFNFNSNELEAKFFPNSSILINTIEDKIGFLNKFIELSKSQAPKNIFEFQYYWSSTLFTLVKELNSKNSSLIDFLKVHFDHFVDTDGKARLDILFGINEIINVNDKTLFNFFNTLKKSISIFQNQVTIKEFDISEEVDVFLNETFSTKDDNLPWEIISDYILSELTVTTSFDQLQSKDVYSVVLDNQDVSDATFFNYDAFSGTFASISSEELQLIAHKSKIYCNVINATIYIYIPDDELLKAYSRVALRDSIYSKSHDTKIHGNENLRKLFPKSSASLNAEKVYDNYSRKNDLEKKLAFHYPSRVNIRERVVGWLSIFTDTTIANSELHQYISRNNIEISTLYEAILDVLDAHYYMDADDLDFFKTSLLEYERDSNCIIFPIKNPKYDENGLSRLIDKCQFPPRTFNFLEYKTQLFTHDCTGKDIVIVTDLSISGSQFINSWTYYCGEYETGTDMNVINNSKIKGKSTTPQQERYFCFETVAESIRLNDNIKNAKSITILSPVMTKAFSEKIQKLDNSILLKHSKELIDEEKYLYGKARLNNTSDELFAKLCLDIELINKLFNDTVFYKDHITEKSIKESNIILRTESLPAKHLLLLTLEAKNGIRLLDHISNWKKTSTK